jgi:hypothetical protein
MEPDVIDLKIGFDNGSIRVQISEYDNFEQVISGLRGLGSEEYLRALWESLKEADSEIGTGGQVGIYDLIHDYVYEGGDDE